MSKQINLLRKLGEATLLDLLDEDLLELLQSLKLTNFDTSSLSELIIEVEGEACVADNSELRTRILRSLSEVDARDLCSQLGLPTEGNAWQILLNQKFRKGSKLYREFRTWLGLPIEETQVLVKSPTEKYTNIKPGYALFDHQIAAVNKSTDLLFNKDRLILHMPTGAGKTRTAMNLISDFFRKSGQKTDLVIWLAHSEELCEQAAEEFERAWFHLGNRSVKVVRHFRPFTGQNIEVNGPTFIVMSLQSAYSMSLSRTNDENFFQLAQKVGLTIIDEAHKATAETYQHVLQLLAPQGGSAKLLGLTATPGRSWLDPDEDEKLANFFNRNKVSLEVEGYDNPIAYLRDQGYLAKQETIKIEYSGDHQLTISDLKNGDFTPEQLNLIGKDAARNLRILDSVVTEARNGGSIILFACSVAHAKLLTILLRLKNYKAAFVTGATPPSLREQHIADFKNGRLQILVNFGVLTTGFDAPKANVAIIARPTQSLVLYSQMVGRVIRGEHAGGTKSCRVVTVVDQQYGFTDLSESFDFWDDIWE